MKKLLAITAMIGVTFFLSSSAFAVTNGATTAGGQAVVIDDPTAPDSGSELNVTPSPGVVMKWWTESNSYTLTSLNVSASDGNRNEYGIWSNFAGYYQQEDATTGDTATIINGLTVPTNPAGTTTPTCFSGWTQMGGAAGGS